MPMEPFSDVRQITCLSFHFEVDLERISQPICVQIRNVEENEANVFFSIGGLIYVHLFRKHNSEKGRKEKGTKVLLILGISIVNFKRGACPEAHKGF